MDKIASHKSRANINQNYKEELKLFSNGQYFNHEKLLYGFLSRKFL
jgi:hypothetical protein